jgi:AcrR family transcriptional regulator
MADMADRIRPGGNPRGEDTRRRILDAALSLFGSLGFEATGTRALAERAGVNLPAIQYYFGSKEGLYRAVIQQIAERIETSAGPVADRITGALAGQPTRADLLALLFDLTDVLVALILDETLADRDSCRRFFARVEIEQNPAINALHDCVARHILTPGAALIGHLMRRPPADEKVRMRMVALMGEAKAFGCWGSDRVLGWHSADPTRVRAVQQLLREHVAAIFQESAPQ